MEKKTVVSIKEQRRKIINEKNYSLNYRFWFITITLKPFLYTKKPSEQLEMTREYIKHVIRNMNDNNTIVCELTDAINIHYHCVVLAPELVVIESLIRMKNYYNKTFGFFNYKAVDDLNGLKEYLSKDFYRTIHVYGLNPIINDTADLFDVMEQYYLKEKPKEGKMINYIPDEKTRNDLLIRANESTDYF